MGQFWRESDQFPDSAVLRRQASKTLYVDCLFIKATLKVVKNQKKKISGCRPGPHGINERFLYSEDICIQTLFLLFKSVLKTLKKKLFVSPANSSLVGILITIDDVTDIFAIQAFL